MKMLVKVKLSEHRSKTPEGYLICRDCILARTGQQEYYRSELYPNEECDGGEDDIILVDRKPEQVFSDATLASFENKPLTFEHPDENVNPENYKELACGFVRDVRRGKSDGQDVMIANIVVTDAEAIEAIESGSMRDLSCGYDCDLTEGDHPEQINIRGNHVALCEQGRAGIARIVDNKSVKDGGHKIEEDTLWVKIPKGIFYQQVGRWPRDFEMWMNVDFETDKAYHGKLEFERKGKNGVAPLQATQMWVAKSLVKETADANKMDQMMGMTEDSITQEYAQIHKDWVERFGPKIYDYVGQYLAEHPELSLSKLYYNEDEYNKFIDWYLPHKVTDAKRAGINYDADFYKKKIEQLETQLQELKKSKNAPDDEKDKLRYLNQKMRLESEINNQIKQYSIKLLQKKLDE